MKKFMPLVVLFVLAGTAYFFVYLDFVGHKKEIKTAPRDYSSEFSHDTGSKKATYQKDEYAPLDPPASPALSRTHRISDTEIANFINASLPLNPWLVDPDTLKCGDTITWNCKARGFDNNPRIGVTQNHFMWIKARELLEFIHGVSDPSETSVISDSESVDLTKDELKEQKKLDSLSYVSEIQANNLYAGECKKKFFKVLFVVVFFVMFSVCLVFKILFHLADKKQKRLALLNKK